jgi:hypothetical protein
MVCRRLSGRQLAVIDELVDGKMVEQEVLSQHKVGRKLFAKWLADETFVGRLKEQIEFRRLQAQAMLASSTCGAIMKLKELTGSKEDETARKASVDVMRLFKNMKPEEKTERRPRGAVAMSAETARKVRALLAEEQRAKKKQG